jgi:hypothetical protein
MTYTVYHNTTGEILYTLHCQDHSQALISLEGLTWIEGHYSGDQYYVHNGQAQRRPEKPAEFYNFDPVLHEWVIDTAQAQQHTRHRRDQLLTQVDRVNPIWYASLTNLQQQELVQYRQALLDIPQQQDFPQAVIWPSKPNWL